MTNIKFAIYITLFDQHALLLGQTFDVRKERSWSWLVALKHGKNACEVVEKDTDVAEVVVAVTLEDVQWNSRCALVPECM